jgi:hypothetical protein
MKGYRKFMSENTYSITADEPDFLDNATLKFYKEEQLKEQQLAVQIQAAEEAWKKCFYELYT